MSKSAPSKVDTINSRIKKNKAVDREDLLNFLKTLDTNDADTIVEKVKAWLKGLHDDPQYEGVSFPDGHIDAVLGDLGAYGVLQSDTILKLQEESVQNLA